VANNDITFTIGEPDKLVNLEEFGIDVAGCEITYELQDTGDVNLDYD